MSEYADRNPIELEPHFSKHMLAMTAENLFSKAAIAEELAYRDKKIEHLTQELSQAKEQLAAHVKDSVYWSDRAHGLEEQLAARENEIAAKVLEEAAAEFDKTSYLEGCGGFNFAKALRRMAQERRRKC